jgi:hypothetical protein
MLLSVIEKPENDEDGQWISLKELSALLKQHFRGYKEEVGTFRKIGLFLSRPEMLFKSRRQSTGMFYWVKLRD